MFYQRTFGVMTAARLAAVIFALAVAMGGAARAAQPPGKVDPSRIRVPSGTRLILELQTPINTTTARKGDRVIFKLIREIEVGGKTALPKGSLFSATVMDVKSARNSKRPEVEFRLDAVEFDDGTKIPLSASKMNPKADKGDSLSGGGGSTVQGIQRGMGQAVQGAFLGGMFGGRTGALTGALAAAGLEILGQRTGGGARRAPQEMDLPDGLILEPKLERDLDIPVRIASPSLATRGNGQNVQGAVQGRLGGGGAPEFENITGRREPRSAEEIFENRPQELGRNPVITVAAAEEIEAPTAAAPLIIVQPSDEPIAWASRPAFDANNPANDTDEPTEFILSVNVRLAQIDALVRDKNLKTMDNLKTGDFRLFEDGIERPIQSLSRDQVPTAVALVVDRSASIANFRNSIQSAAYKALSQLKKGDTAALYVFPAVERLEDSTTDFQRIARRIERINIVTGIGIVDAIYEASAYLERTAPDKRRAIILISDNEEPATVPDGYYRNHSIDETMKLTMRTETVVYSVEMEAGGSSFIPLLIPQPSFANNTGTAHRITEKTGGEVFKVSSSNVGAVEKALSTAINRIKSRYTLGYSPSGSDGEFHTIEVRLAERFGNPGNQYTILARSGTYDIASINKKR